MSNKFGYTVGTISNYRQLLIGEAPEAYTASERKEYSS